MCGGTGGDGCDGAREAVGDAETLADADQRVQHRVEAAERIPDPLRELGVLEQGKSAGGVEGGHAQVHGAEGEGAAEALGAEVEGGARPDGLEGMQGQKGAEDGEAQHGQQGGVGLAQDVLHAELVVPVRFLQEGQVPLEAGLALPALDGGFHARRVGRELERLAVVEEELVVRLRLDQRDALRGERGAEVGEGLLKHAWQEQEGGALIEALQGVSMILLLSAWLGYIRSHLCG